MKNFFKSFKSNKPRIRVKHVVLGTHNWPSAGEVFPEVRFLQHEHHHDFHIWAECDVNHDDREIEFIMLRVELMKIIDINWTGKYIKKFGPSSCEMIGKEILTALEKKYGSRNWKIEVYEDAIQGGILNE